MDSLSACCMIVCLRISLLLGLREWYRSGYGVVWYMQWHRIENRYSSKQRCMDTCAQTLPSGMQEWRRQWVSFRPPAMFDFFLLRMLMHHNVSVLCKWTWRSSTKGKPEQNCHAQQRTAHTQGHYYQSLVSKSLKNLWASTIHQGFQKFESFSIYIYTVTPKELYIFEALLWYHLL